MVTMKKDKYLLSPGDKHIQWPTQVMSRKQGEPVSSKSSIISNI